MPRFRLLGTVQVWRNGEELDLGGPLQRALLVCLLLNVGWVVSREQLIDALWDVAPPPRAARSLETKVSRLGATLTDCATVVASRGGYVLDAPVDEIDVWKFRQRLAEARALLGGDPRVARARLEVALALWRGKPLGGVPEGVLYVEREHLEDERLEALEARIDADLALGEGASLVGELQALRSEHPARERVTEQLMLALYRSGRQAEALAAYRVTYRGLRDEFGLEPGPRLRQLEQAILRHDESLGPLLLRARLAGASRRRRWLGVAAIGSGILLAVVLAATSGRTHQRRVPPRPGLILLITASDAMRADVPVGYSQGQSRFGYGHLWTIGEDGVMSELDPGKGALVRSIPVGVQPEASLWAPARSGSRLQQPDAVADRPGDRTDRSSSAPVDARLAAPRAQQTARSRSTRARYGSHVGPRLWIASTPRH